MELFRIAWKNLFRNKRRTLASLMTVALGTTGLLIYQGFNTGIMNQYRENVIRGVYGYGQVFTRGYWGKVQEKPWERWIENPDEIKKTLLSLPGIQKVFPRLGFYSFLTKGHINLSGRGEGVDFAAESTFFTQMNYISGNEIRAPDEIILGKGLAESLDAKVGDTVTVLVQTIHGQMNGADLKVAGIFHTGLKAFDDVYFRVDLKQAQFLLDTNKVELFSLQTLGVDHWSSISTAISKTLPHLESVPFEELDATYYKNSVDFLETQFSFIRSIILFIVALGIFNTITVGLFERAGEIGALRANGESRQRLRFLLTLENSFLGFLGGLLGALMALLLNHTLFAAGVPMPPGPGITRHFMVFIEILPAPILSAIVLTSLATLLASSLPIRKLLKKSIPELLRSH